MAFNPHKIYPIDTKPGTAVGIALPFNAPSVFFSTYTTKDAIKNNLLNFFLTNKNERYLNNNFGADLRKYLFEQISSNEISSLKENIQTLINQNFNNVQVKNLDILENPNTNSITIQLSYDIINTGMGDTIEITFTQ